MLPPPSLTPDQVASYHRDGETPWTGWRGRGAWRGRVGALAFTRRRCPGRAAPLTVQPPPALTLSLSLSPSSPSHTGFLVVPGFLSPADVAALRARGQQLLEAFDPASPEARAVFSSTNQFRVSTDHFLASAATASYFFEEGAFDEAGALTAPPAACVNKIAHALHEVDPAFRAFTRSPRVAGLAAALGYDRPLPVQSMYICKQPGIGGEVVPHQDSTFLATTPAPSVFGVWVALEDADEANGCLWALPGSHGGPVRRRFGRGLSEGKQEGGEEWYGKEREEEGAGGAGGRGGGEDGEGGRAARAAPGADADAAGAPPAPSVGFDRPAPAYDLAGGVPLPAPAGTLVLLHGSVIHWSAPNSGASSRHAFTVHVAEGGKGLAWAADNWLQRPADMPFEAMYDAGGRAAGAGRRP